MMIMIESSVFSSLLTLILLSLCNCRLLPRESSSREIKDLSGVWNFRLSPHFQPELGFQQKWFQKSLKLTGKVIPMPVPSSYNDITVDKTIRDHLGWVWYDRQFVVPKSWNDSNTRVNIRFGSVHYTAIVFLNGISVVNHTGGHLPFEAELSEHINWSGSNLLTVAVNNTLTPDTVPQGRTVYYNDSDKYPPGYHQLQYKFDFFNYAGIHRPVILFTTPRNFIYDISIRTGIVDNITGIIHYTIDYFNTSNNRASCQVHLYDKFDMLVAEMNGCNGDIYVRNANLWWPFTMHDQPGYLYQMKVVVTSVTDGSSDEYWLPVGIREVKWDKSALYINNKHLYFTGFGKHEDSDIRGKGMDLPLIIRDFNMIKYLGANSFRTSHYPYADEILDQADEQGILVIEECPAVSLHTFGPNLYKQHMYTITEMIDRDKNRPSVVMWSLANEPHSGEHSAHDYFRKLTEHTRNLDHTRPITAVLNVNYKLDKIGEFMDVICVNRYFAWYSDVGETELIHRQTVNEYTKWFKKYDKPIMASEYGADTIPGLHRMPSYVFTEDYQVELITNYHRAFDELRTKGFFIGEHIWNFADFMTQQSITRVVGNKKGILTRDRQPKMAAYIIRRRYWELAQRNSTNDNNVNILHKCCNDEL